MKDQIYEAISREREYQDQKWGDRNHSIPAWITIMRAELEEAEKAWLKEGDRYALLEILQVAAVGVACLEKHGVVERQ